MKTSITSLLNFISASKGQNQSNILREFIKTIIIDNDVCESGSILIDNPSESKLELFDVDFLFSQGLLEEGQPWTKEFDYYTGIAADAYRFGTIQKVNSVEEDSNFSFKNGNVAISNIVCVPISLSTVRSGKPFGIINFHNSSEDRVFKSEEIELIKVYCNILELILEGCHKDFNLRKDKQVFIVHGRDDYALKSLELILRKLEVKYKILKDEPKTGYEILEQLENNIELCSAGFILLTPDDEGKLKNETDDSQPEPRARENVIFESGILTALYRSEKRLCFLVKQPVELPSDMKGLLYEEFKEELNEEKIKNVLIKWGLLLS